jgi:hypothetical protein
MFFVVEIETEKRFGLYDADTQIWPATSLVASPVPEHEGRPAAGYTVQFVVYKLSPKSAKDGEAVRKIMAAAARKSNFMLANLLFPDLSYKH